jgi:tRNA/rRNA methyltransferase
LLTAAQRDRIDVVLVSPRNPLNIGAVARAMANFGFSHLTVVAPFAPHWREARSAVGAPELLQSAVEKSTLAEALAACTFVAGTGTLTHRKPEQPVISLPDVGPVLAQHVFADRGGRMGLVFGPEKHGLTRDHLSYCHVLLEIPTDPRQPSMNLGQAVALCLYEIGCLDAKQTPQHAREPRTGECGVPPFSQVDAEAMVSGEGSVSATSGALDRLADLIEMTMLEAGYSPRAMQPANRHDLRLLLRRLEPSTLDTRRMLGLFRRILYRIERTRRPSH